MFSSILLCFQNWHWSSMSAVAAHVSTNDNTTVNENEANTCANESATIENDSATTDATCMSTDSAVSSASAYKAIQQYSEAELHGEYEAQYFGFTADSVADGRK